MILTWMTMSYRHFNRTRFLSRAKAKGLTNSIHRVRYTPENLEKAIELSGIDEKQFARLIRRPYANVCMWLAGESSPQEKSLEAILRATGLVFFFGSHGKFFEATPEGLRQALEHYGVKQIDLAIKSRVNKGYISQFLNKKKGYRKGLNARIWRSFAYALDCRFYIKKRVENDSN